MLTTIRTTTLALALGATAALAHEGVKDPDVKARMDLMEEIRDATATLGGMARGKIAFDEEEAAAARAALIDHAEEIPAVFETEAMDPESEALPAIWDEYGDFTDRAETLVGAAEAMETGSLDAVRAGIRDVGRTCGGCHEVFRVDK